jgi:hypothetical protein
MACSSASPSAGRRFSSSARGVLAEAEVSLTGGLSPRVLPMGEIRDLGALLQRAGFALPVADNADAGGQLREPDADPRPERAWARRTLWPNAIGGCLHDGCSRGNAGLLYRISGDRRPRPGHVRACLPHRLGAVRDASRSRFAPAPRRRVSPMRWEPLNFPPATRPDGPAIDLGEMTICPPSVTLSQMRTDLK